MAYTYTISSAQMFFFIILLLWELAWTSVALWRAARLKQPYWFGIMLVVNTVGILPIIYLILTRSQKDSTSEHLLKTPLTDRG